MFNFALAEFDIKSGEEGQRYRGKDVSRRGESEMAIRGEWQIPFNPLSSFNDTQRALPSPPFLFSTA